MMKEGSEEGKRVEDRIREEKRGEKSQDKYSPVEILTGHPELMNRVVWSYINLSLS